jgi:opacity protein-like surface antigen
LKKLILTLFLVMSLIASTQATAQNSARVPRKQDSSHVSIQTGIGFYADDDWDGFLWSADGLYHFDRSWSAGVELHVGAEDDLTIVSMPFYSRYDSPNLPVDQPLLSRVRFFAKAGIGFNWAEIDQRFDDDDDTGFLFMIGGGAAYEMNDRFSLESAMQFNVTTNDYFDDDFYYSWEVIGLRYHF